MTTCPVNGDVCKAAPPRRWLNWLVCLLLALGVWIVFGQTLHHDFVNFDDSEYVYENATITRGLNFTGVAWAFTHFHVCNWHPITTLSHMLDCQLYGLNAGGHHLTNVLLHGANVILLFILLRNITGALWRSAFVAAVFAIHPLRVESVAWVSDRKDLMCGLFFMLTLWTYTLYAKAGRSEGGNQEAKSEAKKPLKSGYYWASLTFFILGLMSKPMLVTLPFVLLLLDYWPLSRITEQDFHSKAGSLVLEKIPFLLLSFVGCILAVAAQKEAIAPVQYFGLTTRVGSAVISCAIYLWQMVYPTGLAIPYPHPGNHVPTWEVGISGVVLTAISVVVFRWRRHLRYLIVGWLWNVGMLVPVIGLVQVGIQVRADRYTYLPQIGLYIMVAWWLTDLCRRWRYGQVVLWCAAMAALSSLLVCAHIQTGYWKNSFTLWTHTLACGWESPLTHNNLGNVLVDQGKFDEAIGHYQRALQLKPDDADAHYNLGFALYHQGRLDEAIEHYLQALQLKPDDADAHNNLGYALANQGRLDEAIEHYQRALQLKLDSVGAYYNLGLALAGQGKIREARSCLERALKLAEEEKNNSLQRNIRTKLESLTLTQ